MGVCSKVKIWFFLPDSPTCSCIHAAINGYETVNNGVGCFIGWCKQFIEEELKWNYKIFKL
jgi:hypothetical protein